MGTFSGNYNRNAAENTANLSETGIGVQAVSITVVPDSFMVTLASGDSTERTMVIGNTGTDTLKWNSMVTMQFLSTSLFSETNKNNNTTVTVFKGLSDQKSYTNKIDNYPVQRKDNGVTNNPNSYPTAKATISASTPLYGIDASGLHEINPLTGAIIHSLPLSISSGGPHGLCYDGSYIYFIDGYGINRIIRIDRTLSSIIDTIAVDFPGYIDGLATNGTSVYALNYSSSVVYEVDLSSQSIVNTLNFSLTIGGGMSYAAMRNSFFISNFCSAIYEIDANDGHLINTLTPSICAYGVAYSNSSDALFISDYGSQTQVLNPATGEVISSFSGGYDALASDETYSNLISLAPTSGVVASDSTQTVIVKFNAKKLYGGDYRANISITSNDPLNNPKIVPANMRVIGIPMIDIPDTLNVGAAFVGIERVDSIKVKNTGSDLLNVTNITSNSPFFTTNVTNFSVSPGKEQTVIVSFTPADGITYNGVLTFASNDSLHPTIDVVLQGQGLYPPVISVTPSSLSVNLLTGQSTTRTLTISNTGSSELRFDATVAFNGFSNLSKSLPTTTAVSSSSSGSIQAGAEYVPNQVIVRFKEQNKGILSAQAMSIRSNLNATVLKEFKTTGAELWNLTGVSVADAIAQYKDNPQIEYIEPNYIVHAFDRIPNDPYFSQLWGMQKISAPAAWDRTTGTEIVIGDIDTGIDTSHVDLAANLWTNPGEISGNGIDDDGNGFIDDVHGWNFVSNTNNVYDDHSHGTHTAGTIAAVGNNGIGVVGVCWSAKIMAIKFLDGGGSGTTAGAISSVEYATKMHARLTSNSWGGGGYSQALYDAIKAAGDGGALFVAAAGNSSMNTDIYSNYPSGYDLDNIIAVASTTSNDALSSFSNYGLVTVDLGAPGSDVLSTLPGNSYGSYSGTSMATPHVSGVAGLVLSLNPMLNWAEVKNIILSSVDSISSLNGKTVTGGRLDAARALQNTLTWVALSPLSGTVARGSSVDLTVTFDAANLNGGDYLSTIKINSNDPIHSVVDVPASMHVTGNPVIAVIPDTVKAGVAFVGMNHVDTMRVRNIGSDILNVTDITSNLSVFTTNVTNFSVSPGREQAVAVEFAPTDTIAYNGVLTIISNDSLHLTVGIVLQGHGAYPPVITVSPDSLSFVLYEKDSASAPLTISNTGPGPLFWSVDELAGIIVDRRMYTLPSTNTSIHNPDAPTTSTTTVNSGSLTSTFADLKGKRIGFMYGSYSTIMSDLRSRGASVSTLSPPLSSAMLDTIDVIAVDDILSSLTSSDVTLLRNWVQAGHGILVQGDDASSMTNINALIAGTGITEISLGTYIDGTFTDITPHQITEGVDTVVGSAYGSYCNAESPASVLVRNNSAQPYIVISSLGTGRVIVVCNEIGYDVDNTGIGDTRVLANRAFDWLVGGGAFVKVEPTSGTVAPGSSEVLMVKANAQNVSPGLHQTIIALYNNDPLHNPKNVPVSMLVIGKPVIAVTPDTLKYNPVYVGVTSVDTLQIRNIGSDALEVSSITASDTVFHLNRTSFVVSPGGQENVLIGLTPSTAGVIAAMITITSNDSSALTKVVPIRGEAFYPPVITVAPDSFAVELMQGDSTIQTLRIGNTGNGVLNWSIKNGLNFAVQTTLPHVVTDNDLLILQQNAQVPPFKSVVSTNQDLIQRNVLSLPAFSNSSAGSIIRQFNLPATGWTGLYASSSSLWALNYSDGKLYQVDTGNGSLLSSVFLRTSPYSLVFDGNYFWVGDGTNRIEAYTSAGVLVKYITTPFSNFKAIAWDGTNFWFCQAFTTNPMIYKTDILGNILETYSTNISQMVSSMIWVPGHTDGHLWVADYSTRSVKQLNISGGLTTVVNSFTAPNSDYLYAITHNGENLYTLDWDGTIYELDDGVIEADWLSADPSFGTIASGSTQDVSIKFSAKDLPAGDYRSTISIMSNDPVNNPKNIPAKMHVIGIPVIAVVPDTVKSGVVFVGATHIDTVKVRNIGSDLLNVTNIASNSSVFTTNITNFSVSPGGEQKVAVAFAPTDTLPYNGVLTITSNDSLHPMVEIVLQGQGAYPPVITVSPDSFAVTLVQGDSTMRTMRISNVGKSNLEFTLTNSFNTVSMQVNSETKTIIIEVPKNYAGNQAVTSEFPKTVAVSSSATLRILTINTGVSENYLALDLLGYAYTRVTPSEFATVNLSNFDVLYIGWTYGAITASLQALYDRRVDIQNFVKAGGGLVALAEDPSVSLSWTWLPVSVGAQSQYGDNVHILNPAHPVLDSLSDALLSNWSLSYHNVFNSYDPSLEVLANSTSSGNLPLLLTGTVGNGRVVVTGLDPDYHFVYGGAVGAGKLLSNMLKWAAQPTRWLSAQPTSGVIDTGSSIDINVFFNARFTPPGDYYADIVINSNDPMDSVKLIPVHLTVTSIPDLVSEVEMTIPTVFALRQNYPNPFNPSTTIQYDLPKSAYVTLSIYNILGELVTTLIDGTRSAGTYSVQWNCQTRYGTASSGIYFAVIQAGDFRKTVKMILMK
jgi:subtilisin family serine protease/glutamine cyclotransferase